MGLDQDDIKTGIEHNLRAAGELQPVGQRRHHACLQAHQAFNRQG